MQTINIIVTDIGEYPMPVDISRRFDAVRKTKTRRLDRRTREGKALTVWERQFCADKLKEWATRKKPAARRSGPYTEGRGYEGTE